MANHSDTGRFESAFSDEQNDILKLEVQRYVSEGKLSKLGAKGVARELQQLKDENGGLVFLDNREGHEGEVIHLETIRKKVAKLRRHWRTELIDGAKELLAEATYAQARAAKDSPQSLKAVAEIIEPKQTNEQSNRPQLSPVLIQIRERAGMGTTISVGKDGRVETVRNPGHECLDTVHSLADGRGADITTEVVSSGHDKLVHGVSEGGDTAEGSAVSDTSVSSEDSVDNDSGGDLGSAKQPGRGCTC